MSAKRTKGLYKYSDSKNWWFRYNDPLTGKRKAVSLCTSPKKTDTEIWLTVTVCGLIRTLHFVQGRNPA